MQNYKKEQCKIRIFSSYQGPLYATIRTAHFHYTHYTYRHKKSEQNVNLFA